MRIEVTATPSSNRGMSVAKITHKDNSLTWDVSIYDRVTFADIPTVFDCINDYWKTQPPETLDQIFEVYASIHETLPKSNDIYTLNSILSKLVARLYSLMPYEKLRYWVNYKADVKIPSNILVDYSPSQLGPMPQRFRKTEEVDPDGPVVLPSDTGNDLNYPRELTYLRKDYQELAVLSVAVRPMIPIWGEYIRHTSEQVGGMFKEYEAMRLLYETELPEVEPMKRLMTYMEYWVANEKQISYSAILGGLSITILPSWLLAGCIVRRIAFGQIHATDDKQSIISNVYKYVSSTMKSINDSFNGRVNSKKLPKEMNEEDNSSLADMYKVKQDISDADLVAMNIYTENVYAFANRIDPTIPRETLDACLLFMDEMTRSKIKQHQLILVGWMVHPTLSSRCIPYLNKGSMLRSMAITQATLWHWGYPELAAFITAKERPARELSIQWGAESRSRVPPALVEELVLKFPYYRRRRGKDTSTRQLNIAYRSIDEFCDILSKSEWTLNAPEFIAEKVEAIGTMKQMVIPADIRAMLAKLLIQLASR